MRRDSLEVVLHVHLGHVPDAMPLVAHPLPENVQQVVAEVGGVLVLHHEGQPVPALGLGHGRDVCQRQLPVADGRTVILLAGPFLHVCTRELQVTRLCAAAVVLIDLCQDAGIDGLHLGTCGLGAQGLQLGHVGEEAVWCPLLVQGGGTQTGTEHLAQMSLGLGLLQDLLHDGVGRLWLAVLLLFLFLLPQGIVGLCRGEEGDEAHEESEKEWFHGLILINDVHLRRG